MTCEVPIRVHKTAKSAVKRRDEARASFRKTTAYRLRAGRSWFMAMIARQSSRIGFLVWSLDNALNCFRRSCWFLGASGLAAGLHLTLRATSKLETVWWIPSVIGRWCDRHGQLQNVPAFFLLALPFLIALRRPNQRLVAILALAAFGTLVELAQLSLPGRWFEWEDIALTWAGLGVAWFFSETSRGLLRALRTFAATRRNYGYPETVCATPIRLNRSH